MNNGEEEELKKCGKCFQSQGSLSELLSKPRPWHKLTDKGRDAFRRIFGWISDDAAIELLCQLSPRKVTLAEKIVHPEPASLLGDSLDGSELATMLETGSGSGSSLDSSKKSESHRRYSNGHGGFALISHNCRPKTSEFPVCLFNPFSENPKDGKGRQCCCG